ncbi:MAG: TIGR01777 family protein [Candidatus Glassbacteria bacterium]|nr:TIGR01777 family protein [Candidatus Glassbacteria bacterium]
MKIAVTGASGLLGRAFRDLAAQSGCIVLPLVRDRRQAGSDAAFWDYRQGELEVEKLETADAVVHLAGDSIATLRWNRKKMRQIEESRVEGTAFLTRKLCKLDSPPRVFVCAGATGFYGDRGEEILDENSPAGDNFLATVCRGWEGACAPLREIGVRVVNLRIGMVLSGQGGALKTMLPAFRLGVGGRLGTGCQWLGWIELSDVARAIEFCLTTDEISGPVNAVAPNPVENREFTRTLASVLRRPAGFPLPAPLLRLLLGRMAEELLLASCRAVPTRLLDHGFEFRYPELEPALRASIA